MRQTLPAEVVTLLESPLFIFSWSRSNFYASYLVSMSFSFAYFKVFLSVFFLFLFCSVKLITFISLLLIQVG